MKKLLFLLYVVSIAVLQPQCWAMEGGEVNAKGVNFHKPNITFSEESEPAGYLSGLSSYLPSMSSVSEGITQYLPGFTQAVTDAVSAAGRKISKTLSPELYKQMVGADKTNAVELEKTKNIYEKIKDKDEQPLSAEQIKQLLERLYYSNLVAVEVINGVLDFTRNQDKYLNQGIRTSQEMFNILKLMHEGENLLYMNGEYDLSLPKGLAIRLADAIKQAEDIFDDIADDKKEHYKSAKERIGNEIKDKE